MRQKWEQDLGCPEDTISVIFSVEDISKIGGAIVLFVWLSFIPDEANWFGATPSCNGDMFFERGECDEVDVSIYTALLSGKIELSDR